MIRYRTQDHGGQQPGLDIGSFRREVAITGHRTVRVVVDAVSSNPDVERSALIQIVAKDDRGLRVPLKGWPHMSARVDEYFYLADGDPQTPATTDVRITVPDEAVKLELIGHRWRARARTTLIGEPIVHIIGGGDPLPLVSPTGATLEWTASDIRHVVPVPAGSERISGAIYARSTSAGHSPVAIHLLDGAGHELMPPEGLPVNPRFGAFLNLPVSTEQTRTDFSIRIPHGVAAVAIQGVEWDVRPAIIAGGPEVWFDEEQSLDTLKRFISDNSERPLLVIDTTAPPLGHETLALRPNNLALEYARLGYAVLFVPFGSTQEFPWLLSDHLAQVPRDLYDELLEHILGQSGSGSRTYVCSSFPSLENNARAENLKRHGWSTVYEIRDDMEEFNRVGYSKWYHPLLEARMAENADLVVTVSTALARRIESMCNKKISPQVVPNGVKTATLDGSAHLRTVDSIADHESGGIVGYVGHLTPSWFDWIAVINAAVELPGTIFEIVGHGKPENLPLPTNVHYLGPKTHDELLEIVRSWKVALIPFIDSPLTRGVDPNKIYEYFSWGLRVVTARMGAVHEYPSTRVYAGSDDLVVAIRETLGTSVSGEEMKVIADFAMNSSWAHRAETMIKLIEGVRA